MLTFLDLITEVKRRSTRNQSGTEFDEGIKQAINSALFRISRETTWRQLRRKSTFNTVTSYAVASTAAVATTSSTTVTVAGATFLTDGVRIGRRVKLSGSGTYYTIAQVTGETSFVLDQSYKSASSTGNTYEILPQDEYVLPAEASHRMFLWHEGFGYPFKMQYITDQDFVEHGAYRTIKSISTHYMMWGEDMVNQQLLSPCVISISSSSTTDTAIPVTIFGIVSGYPDYEVISTNASNGTTVVNGTKTFTSVERITKGQSSTGRIAATANSANCSVATIPAGDITAGILYKKVQLYPLPTKVFPINVQYYKDPYRLVNNGDIHELGQEFDEAIILLATSKLKAETNQNEADRFMLLYIDEIKSLKKTNADKIDWYPRLKRPKENRDGSLVASNLLFQQVGPYYGPSGRW